MNRTGRAALAALALALAAAAAAGRSATRDGPASDADGFAARATRFFDEARTRGCDALPDGPDRRDCIAGALAAAYPAASMRRPGEGRRS